MVQLVHELDLLEHVVPVGSLLVHLQDHHLPGVLVDHLKRDTNAWFNAKNTFD